MKRNLFIGYCWGAAGTTWLAKVLNAHPDVLALHAPGAPGFDRGDDDALLAMVDYLFDARDAGGAYSAVGFTHGIGVNFHEPLRQAHGDRLRGFAVERHPLPRARSQAALITKLRSQPSHAWHSMEAEVEQSVHRLLGRDPELPTDPESTAFYHSCNALNHIVFPARKELPFFRAEDLFTRPETVQDLFRYVSDGRLTLDPILVEGLQSQQVGSHTNSGGDPVEIWRELPDHHRRAFELSLSSEAIDLYEDLGYEVISLVEN